MRCPSCGFGNPEGMNFCGKCARPLAPRCPQCGFENPAGFAFCGKCATPLTPQPPPQVASSQLSVASPQPLAPGPQPPVSYTPKYLAERIRAEQAAMEARGAPDGERKTITALFADVAGFTALARDLDPEDTRAIVDPALQLRMDAVHRYEGYVAQSLGDGIFALFGAPIAHEDHVQRALCAALRMQEEMRQYAGRIRLEKGVPLQMRVGINTGEVVLRSIRKDDLHTDYVPVGHSINLASRMESLAMPGSIVVSEHTYKLIEGYFDCKALGAVQVKGLDEPVSIYEVLGIGPLRTRLQVAARRGLVRFVGRQSELEQLKKTLEQVRAGHGQIVGVMGEPGVGKSRLLYEFKLLSQKGCLVLETFSVSHGKAYPYLPLIDLLKNYFQLAPQDDERQRQEKITGRVLILAKTEGNPFFMEEIVQALVEQGVLPDPRRVGTAHLPLTLAKPLADLKIPPTVQGVLASRIDRLLAEEKELLQTLAVIGKEFPLSLLTQVVDKPEDKLHGLLSHLQTAEFIYEQPAFPEVEYTFKHALTQEVVCNSVLQGRRKVLHERTAQAIEALFHSRLEDHYSDLAHHYSRSSNTQKAVEYLQLAGQQAVQRSANVEAIGHLTAALELLKSLPDTPERVQQELTLQLTLGPALMTTKGYGASEVAQTYNRARELCQQMGETPQLFPVLHGLCLFHIVRAEHLMAWELGEHLLTIAQNVTDATLLLEAHFLLGETLYVLGDLTAAQLHLGKGIDLYDARHHHSHAFLHGQDPFVKAIGIAKQQQAKSLELRAVMSLGRLWQKQGKKKEAHKMLSEIYNWFTEGFDTKDLQEAKALLEELNH